MIADYILAVVLSLQIIAIGLMIARVLVRKTVRSLAFGYLLLLVSNLLLAVLNLCYPLDVILGGNFRNVSFPISDGLLSFVVLMITLLDIELLRVFATLNEKITDYKLKIFSTLLILSYTLLPLLSQLLDLFVRTEWSALYYYYCFQLFALIGILTDNSIAFYLPFLVYNYKQTRNKLVSKQLVKHLKKLVLLNMLVMVIDWLAFGLSFYANIVLPGFDTTVAYLIILGEVLVGIHSIFQIIVLLALKALSLTEMEEIPSEIPPSTVCLPRESNI
ncbi:hypothetical protein HDV01_000847 [Terramyces sp. JEL0728]|nr:hypothetical protein HDV01_000847 [Terramyces sp. JEL0728]